MRIVMDLVEIWHSGGFFVPGQCLWMTRTLGSLEFSAVGGSYLMILYSFYDGTLVNLPEVRLPRNPMYAPSSCGSQSPPFSYQIIEIIENSSGKKPCLQMPC